MVTSFFLFQMLGEKFSKCGLQCLHALYALSTYLHKFKLSFAVITVLFSLLCNNTFEFFGRLVRLENWYFWVYFFKCIE